MTDRRMAIDPGERRVVAQLCDGRARRTGARRAGAGVRTVDTSASQGTGSPSRLVLRLSAGERRPGPARPGGEPQQIFSGRRPELDIPAFYLAEIADLVAHRAAPNHPERLVDAICRRAGDPDFIRELVRHLFDDGALSRDRLTRLSELGLLARLRHAPRPASRARLRGVHEDPADELVHPPARPPERGGALDVAEFRREGDFWSITFEAQTVRLRDARGMRYLALLLAHPGRDLHVNDIVSRAVGGGDGRVRGVPRDAGDHLRIDLGDAGPVSDARARSEYAPSFAMSSITPSRRTTSVGSRTSARRSRRSRPSSRGGSQSEVFVARRARPPDRDQRSETRSRADRREPRGARPSLRRHDPTRLLLCLPAGPAPTDLLEDLG